MQNRSERTNDIRSTNIQAAKGNKTKQINTNFKINKKNKAVANVIRTSLGPRGMDKMIQNAKVKFI